MPNALLVKLTGLHHFIVPIALRKYDGFYVPRENATTADVHLRCQESRIAERRLDAYRAKSIEVEWCEKVWAEHACKYLT